MAGKPEVVETVDALRAQVAAWRAAGEKVALVPTMGALHEGHIALVRQAKTLARRIVVSIFVNPTQFAPNEDFSRYP
ncbi:MAG: pantoate--beta-alanine ligase, partial [Pseudomonadota bacterium]